MVARPRSTRLQLSPEAQYREVYESLRQHDRFIWHTPAIVVVIDGALIVSTFAWINVWWIREVIIGCSLVLTVILTFALIKHRYFSAIEQHALTSLEGTYAQRYIQRTSTPQNDRQYWGEATTPTWIQRRSAVRAFIAGMSFISLLLLIILYLNWAIWGS